MDDEEGDSSRYQYYKDPSTMLTDPIYVASNQMTNSVKVNIQMLLSQYPHARLISLDEERSYMVIDSGDSFEDLTDSICEAAGNFYYSLCSLQKGRYILRDISPHGFTKELPLDVIEAKALSDLAGAPFGADASLEDEYKMRIKAELMRRRIKY